jgi:ATP-dependent Clp protease ATP-binding subunit ClpX
MVLGSGKTLLAKTLSQILDVPFATCDATSLTQAGYVGEDVETMVLRLVQNANYDVERASHGIIFIDEVDKIRKRPSAMRETRDVGGEGVQQGLLKMLEGTKVTVQDKKRSNRPEDFTVDTTNILFILSGAFCGLESTVSNRLETSSIGFGGMLTQMDNNGNVEEDNGGNFGFSQARLKDLTRGSKEHYDYIMKQLETSDLIHFGLIPEFVGRVPVVAVLEELDEKALVRALTEPKNSIVSQYEALFAAYNASTFT